MTMVTRDNDEHLLKSDQISQIAEPFDTDSEQRQTQTRIRIRIPKHYHQEPVISKLISQHGLTVNITAALLDSTARDDGWFDLELKGTAAQIRSALIYINELDLEVWHEAENQEDGW